jgi:uncharacterized protein (TIGR02172 family)
MAGLAITTAIDGDIARLGLAGRLDATSADALSAAIPADPALRTLVLDLDACTYVSSMGIRVILSQHKTLAPRGGRVELINVQPDLKRLFELSGLTQLVTIRDKAREITLEGLEYLSEGVFGEVFRIDDETIVKLYRQGVDPAVVEKEKIFSRAAFVAGVPTAISYDIVSAGDRLGIAYEMLGADSLAALMRKSPEQMSDHARLMAQLARTIHNTQADTAVFPDMKASAFGWLDTMAPLLEPDDVALLRRKIEAIPAATTCVHFDLHGGNVMVVNGEPVVIDMGDFSHGSPLFDLGLTTMIYWPLVGICERVTKLPNELGAVFLEHFLDHYFADLPRVERERFERDRPFYASLRFLHSIPLLEAVPDFRAQILGVLRNTLIPMMRAGG